MTDHELLTGDDLHGLEKRALVDEPSAPGDMLPGIADYPGIAEAICAGNAHELDEGELQEDVHDALVQAHAAGAAEMAAVLLRVLPYLLKCGGAKHYLRDLGVSDALSQKARDEEMRPEFDEEADDWAPVGEDTLRALIDEIATKLPRSSP